MMTILCIFVHAINVLLGHVGIQFEKNMQGPFSLLQTEQVQQQKDVSCVLRFAQRVNYVCIPRQTNYVDYALGFTSLLCQRMGIIALGTVFQHSMTLAVYYIVHPHLI